MLRVEVGEIRESFASNSKIEYTMKELNNNWSSSSDSFGGDVWSSTINLFSDCSPQQLINNVNRFDVKDNQPQVIHATEKDINFVCSSRSQSLQDDCDVSPAFVSRIEACQPLDDAKRTRRTSPLCSHLSLPDVSIADSYNEGLLKTPSGFYEKSLPFSGPSIPPLFEHDELYVSVPDSSSCPSPVESVYSESILQNDWTSTTFSSPSTSPCCLSEDSSTSMSLDEESRLCDRLVCSVLSQVIADDLDYVTLLFDTGDNSSPSNKSSTLNPLAPAFQVKTATDHASVAKQTNSSARAMFVNNTQVIAICSPIPAPYVSQSSIAWTYIPTHYKSSRPSSTLQSRRSRHAMMQFTRMHNGCGVWTQFSEPLNAYCYPSVMCASPRPWNSYQQQVCVVPPSCLSFVNVDFPMVLPVNSQISHARRDDIFKQEWTKSCVKLALHEAGPV